ncbi:MAG: riboflavin biosynthesis protein RibF [Pseudomonadota bacterium]
MPLRNGGIVCVGNFDGVHRGHQSLIAQARDYAETHDITLIGLSFDPHPRQFFAPTQPVFALTSPQEKAAWLRHYGISQLITLAFDDDLAAMSAQDFITNILCEIMQISAICVGADFRFGKGRTGNIATLQAQDYFTPLIVDDLTMHDGMPVSSSRVRDAVLHADLALLRDLLGRDYQFCARIIKGDQLGRRLGFPTANLDFAQRLAPKYGVYAVRACLNPDRLAQDPARQNWPLCGVMNCGVRPTVDGMQPRYEVHLFDFAADIYDQQLHVCPIAYLRDEQKFANQETLRAQIAIDCAKARHLFA